MLNTLYFKITAFTCLAIIVSIVGVLWFSLEMSSKQHEKASQQSFVRATRLGNRMVSDEGKNLASNARLVGKLPVLQAVVGSGDLPTIQDKTKYYLDKLKVNIFEVYTPEGKHLHSQIPCSGEKCTHKLIEQFKNGEKEYEVGFRGERPVVYGIAPVESAEELYGWIIIGNYIDKAFFDDMKAMTGLDALIKDKNLVTHQVSEIKENTRVRGSFIRNLGMMPLGLGKNIDQEQNFLRHHEEIGGAEFIFLYNLKDEMKNKMALVQGSYVLGFFVTLLALIMSFFLIRKIFDPLYNMKNTIRQIRHSKNLHKRVFVTGSSEVAELCDSFNAMMDDVEDYNQKIIETSNVVGTSKMAALGEMAGGIAHEINNPLAIIDGYSKQLKYLIKNGNIDEKAIDNVSKKISTTVERISKIIKGLRIFSRDASLDPFEKINIHEVLTDTLALCQEKFMGFGIDVELVNLPEKIDSYGSPVQMAQVFLNLLNNSRDAIEELPSKWIKISARVEGKKIYLRFTDSGEGIPADKLENIFQPFFTTKPIGKGTGLGLSVCQGIIRQHKGTITYVSNSKNTCFEIEIPEEQFIEEKVAS